MAAQTRTLKATCICGESAHEISIRDEDFPLKAYMCHCSSCRHMTGSLCLTVTFLPAYYRPEQSFVDKLTGFSFSNRITQYFCTKCGCHMLARCLADGDDPDSEVSAHLFGSVLLIYTNRTTGYLGCDHRYIGTHRQCTRLARSRAYSRHSRRRIRGHAVGCQREETSTLARSFSLPRRAI